MDTLELLQGANDEYELEQSENKKEKKKKLSPAALKKIQLKLAEEARQHLMKQKQEYLRDTKLRVQEEWERNRAKAEIYETEFRERHEKLEQSFRRLGEIDNAWEEFLQEKRKLEEWEEYTKCNGLPVPSSIPDMNTYIFQWTELESNSGMDYCIKKTDEVMKLLNGLEKIIKNPGPDRPFHFLQDLKELRNTFRDLMQENINRAIFWLFSKLETDMEPINVTSSKYFAECPYFQISLWAELYTPYPSSRKDTMVPLKLHLEEVDVFLVLPSIVLHVHKVLRVIWFKYDHWSDKCRSYDCSPLPDYIKQSMLGLFLLENEVKLDILNSRVILEHKMKSKISAMPTEPSVSQEIFAWDSEPQRVLSEEVTYRECLQEDELGQKTLAMLNEYEVNLRERTFLGDLLLVELLHVPPQPKYLRYKHNITLRDEPPKLYPVDYYVKFPPILEEEEEAEEEEIREVHEHGAKRRFFVEEKVNPEEEERKKLVVIQINKEITAFTVHRKGLFQYAVMPFELHSAPATFQAMMERVLAFFLNIFVFVYLEDMLIASPSCEEHLGRLERVFSKLYAAGLKINWNVRALIFNLTDGSQVVISHGSVRPKPPRLRRTRGRIYNVNTREITLNEKTVLFFELKGEPRKTPPKSIQLMPWIIWYEIPQVAGWDMIRGYWSTEDIHDVTYDEEDGALKFKTGRLGMFGLHVNRYCLFPYEDWLLEGNDEGGVNFYLKTASTEFHFKIKEGQVCLERMRNVPSKAMNWILENYYPPKELKELLKKGGIDVFPDFDSTTFIDGVTSKHVVIESNIYQVWGLFAKKLRFKRSKFNQAVGRGSFVFQAQEVNKDYQVAFCLIQAAMCSCYVLDIYEDDEMYSSDPAPYMKSCVDLYTLLYQNCTMDARRESDVASFLLVQTVREFLCLVRPLSFS